MNEFMNDNFLLKNKVAVNLYTNYAQNLPIIDYHCHLDAKDIYEDVHFENITGLWLSGDHYKWRFMRAAGIEEKFITGDAPDKDKFIKWSEALSEAIGNPLYHWSHLELKKYFGFNSHITKENAEELWFSLNNKLKENSMSAKSIIKASNVSLLCTTDDPADNLYYHELLSKDNSFDTVVLPAFRPDNAMNINKPEYLTYLDKLGVSAGITIDSFDALKEAVKSRMHYFNDHGCLIADHGLTKMVYADYEDSEIEKIFTERLKGNFPSKENFEKFVTAFLLFVHTEYSKLNWTSQLHYGCRRDNNSKMFEQIGPNTGFDAIEPDSGTSNLAPFFDRLCVDNSLPRTIVYSLNPEDNAAIDTIIACFNENPFVCKIQHGSAWWFNDHKPGMEAHLEALAASGNLAGFVGMLTDSRSFVSYTRHDYFRRILCNYLGTLVENNEFPEDYAILSDIVEKICYKNAFNYFKFNLGK